MSPTATTLPVLVLDTPLGRQWYEDEREEGRQEGDHDAVIRLTAVLLRRRFGDDPRIEAITVRLAELSDEGRLALIDAANSLDDLA